MSAEDGPLRQTLGAAFERALAYLESLDRSPVAATVDLAILRRRLDRDLADTGTPPEQVVRQLAADVAGGLLGSAGGRFFGWVIGGALPSALAADWLTAAWDQNAALYACSPAAAVAEEVAGRWLQELLRLPPGASFALVSGCQMAHVVCLAAARHALLARHGWDVERQGLSGAPPLTILSSGARHGSVDRAVRLLGFGSAHLVDLSAGADGRLAPEVLDEALAGIAPSAAVVVLQAGDINLGAFDSFSNLIPLARRRGAWVHVDGAIGLWAAASPRFRHLVDGAAAADSWATDGHKWLNVPYDCGYAFVADPEAHRASLSHRASYLTHDADARDQLDWNPEWSRRARGFPTYAALRELGREGLAALVDRCCDHARAIVDGIGRLAGAEVLWQPILNQGLVRFLDPRPRAGEADHDQRTEDVMATVLATGEAFFGGTTWRGRRAMRVSVSNWRTSADDVERAIRAVERGLASPAGSG